MNDCADRFILPIVLSYIGWILLGILVGLTVGLIIGTLLIPILIGLGIGLAIAILAHAVIVIIKNIVCQCCNKHIPCK